MVMTNRIISPSSNVCRTKLEKREKEKKEEEEVREKVTPIRGNEGRRAMAGLRPADVVEAGRRPAIARLPTALLVNLASANGGGVYPREKVLAVAPGCGVACKSEFQGGFKITF